jgi:putative two-component system protein, hydrogenase maturation factor HypX/HoxX
VIAARRRSTGRSCAAWTPGESRCCRPRPSGTPGPVWASASFPMRAARKSSLYRHEVTEGAVSAVRAALARVAAGLGPLPSAVGRIGSTAGSRSLPQAQRAIDWSRDDTATVLRKIRSADGFPGVEDTLFDRRFRLFDAHPESARLAGRARHAHCAPPRRRLPRDADGAVWIGQLQPETEPQRSFKRPAVLALGRARRDPCRASMRTRRRGGEAAGRRRDPLRGARRNRLSAFRFLQRRAEQRRNASDCAPPTQTRGRPTRVIVLMGGPTSGATACICTASRPPTVPPTPRGTTSTASTISHAIFC